ncbi:hypothetical protein DYU11_22715 [Fibrisoma montanum]|uniref:Uncharacterized protein n=1 Tax=Fibrisoma montanum TaxID=2305895 RepID=A0A418M266_9BACT|nr:hypothetical protein [Fibrisoma montanum]RIV19745.1 hypothetical protein DYU11_22715 [Fibrisoma montanum]
MERYEIINTLLAIEVRLASSGNAEEAERVETIRKEVTRYLDGFSNVVATATTTRSLQKQYFKARKAGQSYDATKLLNQSKDAEQILDNVIKFWTDELSAQPPVQGTLF